MLHHTQLTVTTDAAGAGSFTDQKDILGWIYAVQWVDGTFDNGVDAVLSVVHSDFTNTILTLANANNDAMYYPRHNSHDENGNSLVDNSQSPLAQGKLSLAVTSGGNVKTGGCIVWWWD